MWHFAPEPTTTFSDFTQIVKVKRVYVNANGLSISGRLTPYPMRVHTFPVLK